MKKVILFLFLLITCNIASSQIYVKDGSFRKIDGFVMMDKNDHYDMNDSPMALIKISTENISAAERRRITFKGNLATFFDVHLEPSEIYLYVSISATFIEFHHPDYGKTEFVLPYDLKEFCGYELVLVSDYKADGRVSQQNNYLTIMADNEDASIYIDDEYVGEKEVFKSFNIGSTHTWRIECNLYHTESGQVTITSGNPIIIEKKLREAFGYINVTSAPENGAVVFINDKKVGETPYKSDKMPSGSYKVRVSKDMFKTVEETFFINDGQTTDAVMNMSANFVNLTVNTDSDSYIYVDNEMKTKGNWNGRLSEGAHFIEVKKDNYTTVSKNITLVLGKDETINIEAPQPYTGFIDISSIPMNADIYLNGKHYGKTPRVISDVTIGSYKLKLVKNGYYDLVKEIFVEDNKTLTISEEMIVKPEKTKPEKPNNFFALNAAYSVAPQLSYGFTYGQVRKLGWFVTAMSNFNFKGFDLVEKTVETAILTGETKSTRLSLMGGIVAKVSGPIYAKVGAGYGMRIKCWEMIDGRYIEYPDDTYQGLDLTAGLMFNMNKITLGIDAVTTNFKTLEVKLGIGINWN